ncbi:MAG: hypothetical protein AB7S26_24145 [Sandaracinaceae bacterium]
MPKKRTKKARPKPTAELEPVEAEAATEDRDAPASEGPADDAEVVLEPKRERTKAKREPEKKAEASEEPQKPLPGLGTPEGDRLRQAHVAFDAGDYREVRALCKALESSAKDAAVREAAAELRARVEIDPIQVVVLACCAAVVVGILFKWIL